MAEELVASDSALASLALLLATSRHRDFAAGDLQPAKAHAAWLLTKLAAHGHYM